jgi:hypothetical protein
MLILGTLRASHLIGTQTIEMKMEEKLREVDWDKLKDLDC